MRTVNCKGLEKDWSVITFGCWQIAPSVGWGDVCSRKEADAVVKEALNQGITAFDTAKVMEMVNPNAASGKPWVTKKMTSSSFQKSGPTLN